jgi:hypothetical protein
MVDIRLLHLAEELARVGGERLHIAPLSLGVDGVEGKRRLAAPGETRQNDQAVTRQAEIDVLEVVLSRPSDVDGVVWHLLPSVPRTGRPATNPSASSLGVRRRTCVRYSPRGPPRPELTSKAASQCEFMPPPNYSSDAPGSSATFTSASPGAQSAARRSRTRLTISVSP